MDALIPQIRTLYREADEQTRHKIQKDLRDLQHSFDDSWDIVIRIASGSLQVPFVKTGTDLSIFTTLSSSTEAVSLATLTASTSAAPKLLFHLLRAMAAFGLIDQPSADTFAANRITHTLANVHVSGAISHAYNIQMPVALALPGWLADNKYNDITSNRNLPFQKAMNTDLTPFDWMKQHPEHMVALGHTMAIQREAHWVDSYPITAAIGEYEAAADSALLVDIGGGFGQQALAFKNKIADTKGRIVVQDVRATLNSAPKVEGLEFQEHDFFKEQPIKDAKFYYLSHILHDWTDEDSIQILNAIVPALGPDSRVVIDEIVMPDEQLPWQAAYIDLTLMASFGGFERTKKEFETLLDAAGLRVLEVHRYDAKMHSVIIAAPK